MRASWGQPRRVESIMWSAYHTLRVSNSYKSEWKELLLKIDTTDLNPAFYQFVGHDILKQLIKIRHPIAICSPPALTYQELNGLGTPLATSQVCFDRKSTHPLKEDITLCIHDLIDEGEEEDDETQDWVHAINRGGLTLVNNATYDVFLAIEGEVRKILNDGTKK